MGKPSVTICTNIGLFPGMSSLVANQFSFSDKRFAAQRTAMWPVSGVMLCNMVGKACWVRKRLTTSGTGKRFFSSMCSQMSNQIRFSDKRFVALVTGMWFDAGVNALM